MTYSPPPHWQPVRVAAAEEPVASGLLHPPTEPKGSFTLSEPKRIGTSFTWKSWTKSFKSKTDSEDDSHSTLPACNHGWKPYTMRKRILVPMAIWTAVLAAVIEFLAQKSSRDGGLSLSPNPDDISDLATFSYMFLPTIIAVILSIAWTWVDLDVKRIQPWLELSKDGGATVRDSLSLDYPYDFVAWVPFKSAKRRHWPVFVSGTVMVIIFWVITPLQGAIFGTGPVQIHEPASFHLSSELQPLQNQSRAMDTAILQSMYAITHLDHTHPPFTTAEYALHPFKPTSAPTAGVSNWTTTTTKVWTDLDCRPATWEPAKFEGYFDYHNGQGCNASSVASMGVGDDTRRHLLYLGWHNSAWASQYIERSTCGSEFANQFLAVMAVKESNNTRITALFCETSYWKQRVEVTLPSDTFRPQDALVTSIGPVEELPGTEFNSTGFEYLLGASVSEVQDIERDYPNNLIVDQIDRVNDTGLAWPLSPLVGFAVGSQKRPVDDFFDKTVLEEAFRAVHKSAFVLAYSSLLTGKADKASTDGTAEFVLYGVKVSRPISAVTEGFLLAVGISCIVLAILAGRSRSSLTGDPATLGDLLMVLQNSPGLIDAASLRSSTPKEDNTITRVQPRLYLQCGCLGSSSGMSVHVTGRPGPLCLSTEAERAKGDQDDGEYKPMRPLMLRRLSGCLIVVALVASLVALVFLKHQEQRLGGIPRPTDSFEVLQLLENYIPTTLATMIEPYWVLVNRLLCIFQPYHDLWRGKGGTRARRAVDAKYTALPPQLNVWGALRSGHIMLVTLCLVALLGNVLAVAIGGIFNEELTKISYPVEFLHLQSQEFDVDYMRKSSPNNGRQNDIFTGIKANLTQGTPMPPWVSADFYFQPFAPTTPSDDNSTETYRGRTRGYGLQATCDAVPVLTPILGERTFAVDIGKFKERHGITDPDCRDAFRVGSQDFDEERTAATQGIVTICGYGLLVFWGRMRMDPDPSMDLEIFACHPEFRTALFDVSVDATGRVLSHDRVGDFSSNLEYGKSGNHTARLLNASIEVLQSGSIRWHTDKMSYDWPSDVMKVIAGERLLDPDEPIPERTEMLQLTQSLWRRSFAYLLGSDAVRYAPAAAQQTPISGTRVVTETRIFMSNVAYIVSVAILALYILVAVALYTVSVKSILPRMPTSIAAAVEFTAQSRALQEYSPTPESKSRLRFGRYVGRDGRKHVGIEYVEFVTPVKTASRGLRRRWFGRDRKPPLKGSR